MKVKPEAERSRNYRAAATLVPDRYESGIGRAEWQAPSLTGQKLYADQMAKSEVIARREKAIAKVSDAEFRSAAITKGKPIIKARIEGAVDKQVAGFRPHATALESLTLAAPTDDIDTNIDNRVKPIAKELHAVRLREKYG